MTQLVAIADGPNLDAFSRLRVSGPQTLFDSKMSHDKQPLFWDEVATGAGAASTWADSEVTMEVAANEESVVRQTFQRFLYQPGKSQLVLLTGTVAPESGVTKRVGYFDANNGIFFEVSGGKLYGVIRSATVDVKTELSLTACYADSVLRGAAQGLTVDLTKSAIFVIDFEYLGVGRVRWGLNIDGQLYYLASNFHANRATGPYMLRSNLPLRYEIVSTGGSGSMTQICATVISEGATDLTGMLRSHDNGNTHVDATTAGTSYLLCAIRLKSTHLDAIVTPQAVSVMSQTNDDFLWRLLLNPTIAGTPTWSDLTNSAVQTTVGATANTITGGYVLASGYGRQSTSQASQLGFASALRIGASIAGTPDVLALAITPLGSGTVNADGLGAIEWREQL